MKTIDRERPMAYRNLGPAKKRLGDLLVEVGLITQQQLDEAVRVQRERGGKLGEILQSLGHCSRDVLLAFLGKRSGVSYVSLAEYGRVPPPVLALIPESVARRQTLLPIRKEENVLTVAMADPLNVFATDDLKMMTGCAIEVVIAAEEDLRRAIEDNYGARGAPAVRSPASDGLLQTLLEDAARAGAAAVHLEPEGDDLRVRFRVDGGLRPGPTLPPRCREPLTTQIKGAARMDPSDRWRPQDGWFRAIVNGTPLDVEVSALPAARGERLVLRPLEAADGPDLEELGWPSAALAGFKGLLEARRGLLLAAGPSGSGRTTALHAALRRLRRPDRSLFTLEDPLERRIDGVVQIPSGAGLPAALHQDPDAVFHGCLRGPDAAVGVEAALSRTLLLARVAASDGPAAAVWLGEQGADPASLAGSLLGVLCLRLPQALCPECKEPHAPSPELAKAAGAAPDDIFYTGRGCDRCAGTGLSGRTAVASLYAVDATARELILRRAPAEEIRRAASAGSSPREAALSRAREGAISLEEALRAVEDVPC